MRNNATVHKLLACCEKIMGCTVKLFSLFSIHCVPSICNIAFAESEGDHMKSRGLSPRPFLLFMHKSGEPLEM